MKVLLLGIMTVCATGAGVLGLVAKQAASHRNIFLAGEPIALRHFSVAVLAGVAGRDMGAVAEVYVIGDLIHAHPWDGPLVVEIGRQFPDGRALGLDGGMTLHAGGRGGNAFRLARVGIGMAQLAAEFQRAGMRSVAEWQRLLGSIRGRRRESREDQANRETHCLVDDRYYITPFFDIPRDLLLEWIFSTCTLKLLEM
jgi:hypothetical protein